MRPASRSSALQVWPAYGCALLILVLGSVPSLPGPAQRVGDKMGHGLAFGLLAWLWSRAFAYYRAGAPRWQHLTLGLLASITIGGLLEAWQGFLPYRRSDWLDWVADGIGATLATIVSGVAGSFQKPRATVE